MCACALSYNRRNWPRGGNGTCSRAPEKVKTWEGPRGKQRFINKFVGFRGGGEVEHVARETHLLYED